MIAVRVEAAKANSNVESNNFPGARCHGTGAFVRVNAFRRLGTTSAESPSQEFRFCRGRYLCFNHGALTPECVLQLEEFASVVPNLDSIAEFSVLTSNFGAEYGNFSGGQVVVTTKTGKTNDLHGSAFEFFRNTNFDATELSCTRARCV